MTRGQSLDLPWRLGEFYCFINEIKIHLSDEQCFNRLRRGSDYIEEVGLIMAGSIRPDSRTVELTRDGGKTFEHLGTIPWVWARDSRLRLL